MLWQSAVSPPSARRGYMGIGLAEEAVFRAGRKQADGFRIFFSDLLLFLAFSLVPIGILLV